MARRTKRLSPAIGKIVPSEDITSSFMEKARKQLLDLLHAKGPKKEMYSLTAPIVAPMKMNENKYKNGPLPMTDYMFSSAYFGKRGDPIFNFTSVDAQEFLHMELPLGGLGKAFPPFVEAMMDVLVEAVPALEDYRLEHELPNDSLVAMVSGYLAGREEILKDEARHAETKRKVQEEKAYESNPSWGLF